MSDPYVGEIRLFGGSFAPAGWAFCDGSLVSIAENEVLFNLVGTTYGGDGQETFALPDLRGRVPLHQGTGPGLSPRVVGETGGAESVTLTPSQLPAHTHLLMASQAVGTSPSPANAVPASTVSGLSYTAGAASLPMRAGALSPVGGSQPHDNVMPTVTVTFIISLFGIYPSPA